MGFISRVPGVTCLAPSPSEGRTNATGLSEASGSSTFQEGGSNVQQANLAPAFRGVLGTQSTVLWHPATGRRPRRAPTGSGAANARGRSNGNAVTTSCCSGQQRVLKTQLADAEKNRVGISSHGGGRPPRREQPAGDTPALDDAATSSSQAASCQPSQEGVSPDETTYSVSTQPGRRGVAHRRKPPPARLHRAETSETRWLR